MVCIAKKTIIERANQTLIFIRDLIVLINSAFYKKIRKRKKEIGNENLL